MTNDQIADLDWLHEYKVISTYERIMINEIKIISESLKDISQSLKIDIIDPTISKDKITVKLADILYQITTK